MDVEGRARKKHVLPNIRKQVEEGGKVGSSTGERKSVVLILRDKPMQMSIQTRMIPFNSLVGEEDDIEPANPPHSPWRKAKPAFRSRTSSSGTQHTPRLHVRVTVLKKKHLMEKVCKLIKPR